MEFYTGNSKVIRWYVKRLLFYCFLCGKGAGGCLDKTLHISVILCIMIVGKNVNEMKEMIIWE
jgi:hypothetical protein